MIQSFINLNYIFSYFSSYLPQPPFNPIGSNFTLLTEDNFCLLTEDNFAILLN